MAKADPLPRFHDIPMGAELVDVTGARYRVVGTKWVPLSQFPGAGRKFMLSVRRLSDGVTQDVGELSMSVVREYYPPVRTRVRSAAARCS